VLIEVLAVPVRDYAPATILGREVVQVTEPDKNPTQEQVHTIVLVSLVGFAGLAILAGLCIMLIRRLRN
jgi:hypothetical protein